MAALVCNDCERPAECSCVCRFPLPLLCEEHRLTHTTENHFPLPLNALRHVRDIAAQAELNGRVTKLRRLHSLLSLYSDPLQQPTIDIRDLLIQFYKDVGELKTKVAELEADNAFREVKDEWILRGDVLSCLIWSAETPESELGTWMNIAHGLSLKGEFQYEESCRVLESHWKLVHSDKKVEVLVLSLILSEVMGLHIGRFEEALAILERSLEVANELYPKSEIALQLANMKAAILIHFLSFKDCRDFCNETILNFRDTSTSEVAFGTTLYLYITYYYFRESKPQLEEETIIKKWVLKTENSSNSLIEHIRLYLNAFLVIVDEDFEAAEELLHAAEKLAKRDFPTSNYAALSWYMNFLLRDQMNILGDDFSIDECLRAHFPASLLRAAILERKAESYCYMRKEELIVRLSIHLLLQRNPNCELFIRNVLSIVKLHSVDEQAVADVLESVYRILFERFFASPDFSNLRDLLSIYYQKHGLPIRAFEMYKKTTRKLQATDPTHKLLFEMLTTLSEWAEDTQRDKARQLCIELYQFLREKCPRSENRFNALKTMGKMYLELKMQDKVESIIVEGLQVAKSFYKFKDYVYFIGSLAETLQLSQFSTEKKVAILDEIYAFLVSHASADCLSTAHSIRKLFSGQPERLLTILLAVYRILLASPTSPEMKEYLDALTDFYSETNQLEEAIGTRLEAHQILLSHVTCENFISNVKGLSKWYWEHNQREEAIQFQVEMSRLLLAHPASESCQEILHSLTYYCKEENRQDILLEQYVEAYRTLQPALNPQHNWVVGPLCTLYYEMGSRDTAFQMAHDFLNKKEFITWTGSFHLNRFRDMYNDSGKYQKIIDMYSFAIPIYYESENYSDVPSAFNSICEAFKSSKNKGKAVERILGIFRHLEKRHTEAFVETFCSLLTHIINGRREKEGIAIRKKLLQVFSSRLHEIRSSNTYTARDTNMLILIQQIGEMYSNVNEREKAEACFFRATRIDLFLTRRFPNSTSREYRLLYRGCK